MTERDCFRLFQEAVIKRDKVCQRCRMAPATVAHHIFSRTRHSTAWDLQNGIGLCHQCHQDAHLKRLTFTEFISAYLGAEAYEALQARSQMICQHPDYEAVAKGLKEFIAEKD